MVFLDPNDVPIVMEAKYGPAEARRFTQKVVFSIFDTSLYMFIDKSGISGVPIERDDKRSEYKLRTWYSYVII